MATESRAANARLILYRSLAREPFKYDFFQALRLIECANPDKSKIGTAQRPADDAIRLGQEPSLAFAPSTISSFSLSDNGYPPHLNVLFYGLFGPNGPLPLHLTEYVRDRIRNHNDESLAEFANIFHHRLLSLFYRSWADAQPTASLDREEEDRFSSRISSLLGSGYNPAGEKSAIDFLKFSFAGRFLTQSRNADGLLAVLRHYFDMPVKLEQYVGEWLRIPKQFQLRLGESEDSGSLGLNSTLGERVWQCQYKFRIVMGPLSLEEYQRLLPGGRSLHQLLAILNAYVGDELSWDLKLILKGDEIKPASLGSFGQLGWTAWLPSDYQAEYFDELCVNPTQEVV